MDHSILFCTTLPIDGIIKLLGGIDARYGDVVRNNDAVDVVSLIPATSNKHSCFTLYYEYIFVSPRTKEYVAYKFTYYDIVASLDSISGIATGRCSAYRYEV
jgi:hypothetical protein